MDQESYLLALEGGGTRCQAVLLNSAGVVLASSESTDVNTNFVALEAAHSAVLTAVASVLDKAGVRGESVTHFVSSLVAAHFDTALFRGLLPRAERTTYTERDVVFARAGIYAPHGVAVVAATGATAWARRADDDRQFACGGWGSLLGDEGSAYAVGLRLLRVSTRLYEGRLTTPSRIVEVLRERFGLSDTGFRGELCNLAYQQGLTRAEIAGLAPIATRLAQEGDAVAAEIVRRVAADLSELALFAAQSLFAPHEAFDVALAGGLFNAGSLMIDPLAQRMTAAYPHARLHLGTEEPAIALGHLRLHTLQAQDQES